MMIKNKKPPKNEKNLGGFRSSTTSNYLGVLRQLTYVHKLENHFTPTFL